MGELMAPSLPIAEAVPHARCSHTGREHLRRVSILTSIDAVDKEREHYAHRDNLEVRLDECEGNRAECGEDHVADDRVLATDPFAYPRR